MYNGIIFMTVSSSQQDPVWPPFHTSSTEKSSHSRKMLIYTYIAFFNMKRFLFAYTAFGKSISTVILGLTAEC